MQLLCLPLNRFSSRFVHFSLALLLCELSHAAMVICQARVPFAPFTLLTDVVVVDELLMRTHFVFWFKPNLQHNTKSGCAISTECSLFHLRYNSGKMKYFISFYFQSILVYCDKVSRSAINAHIKLSQIVYHSSRCEERLPSLVLSWFHR